MNPTKRRDAFGVVGFGLAACAACCAGPVLGFLAAIGLFTVTGIAVFGAAGLLAFAPGAVWWARRRRRQVCAAPDEAVPVTLGERA